MIIKEYDLEQHLHPLNSMLYLVFGSDTYLLNQASMRIKQVYSANQETDTQTLHLNKSITWTDVIQQANSYSLLADQVFIDVRYTQKSFDASAKSLILSYLEKPNPKSLILIRAPEVPSKALSWLANQQKALLIQVSALSPKLLQNWIIKQLKQYELRFEHKVPFIIQQHTQNNMHACAQIIEKLCLVCEPNDIITTNFVLKYLDDQSEYPNYELTEACLTADLSKAIQRLRQAQNHHTEPTLILWFLTQEIRQLIALQHQLKQNNNIQQACQALKIWPSRVGNYAQGVKRLSYDKLLTLLQLAQRIDQNLKSYQSQSIWTDLEQLIILMC